MGQSWLTKVSSLARAVLFKLANIENIEKSRLMTLLPKIRRTGHTGATLTSLLKTPQEFPCSLRLSPHSPAGALQDAPTCLLPLPLPAPLQPLRPCHGCLCCDLLRGAFLDHVLNQLPTPLSSQHLLFKITFLICLLVHCSPPNLYTPGRAVLFTTESPVPKTVFRTLHMCSINVKSVNEFLIRW